MGNKESSQSPIEPITIEALEIIKQQTIKQKDAHYKQRFNELSTDYIKQVNSLLQSRASIYGNNSHSAIFIIDTKHFNVSYKYVNEEDDIIMLNNLCDFIIEKFKHFNTSKMKMKKIYNDETEKNYYLCGIMFTMNGTPNKDDSNPPPYNTDNNNKFVVSGNIMSQ